MQPHSVFYYPYATIGQEQSLLLKATALYFDKLYILDPRRANFAGVGVGEIEKDVSLLEQAGILERVAPEQVLHEHENTIATAIQQDLANPEFNKLCAEKGDATWTLALAKVPLPIREDPAYQPIDKSMQRLMSKYQTIYDEYRETQYGTIEYRYANYPFAIGEAIMLNHALVGGMLHSHAVPITDDPLHNRILNYKLQHAQKTPKIQAIIADRMQQQKIAASKVALQSLTDLQLGAIPQEMSLESILEYRSIYKGELDAARKELSMMARKINQRPWTQEFENELFHKTIPELHEALQPVKGSWDSWLKGAGLVLGGAVVVLELFANPVTSIALAVAGLTVAKDAGIGGMQLYQDWKTGKEQNGLHYLLRLK
ncbi:MAG: hypothetical protein H6645_11065 [Caldilineaceae bacterium]|nr:hypothetical protein [Caldilineaceae bacterium]